MQSIVGLLLQAKGWMRLASTLKREEFMFDHNLYLDSIADTRRQYDDEVEEEDDQEETEVGDNGEEDEDKEI